MAVRLLKAGERAGYRCSAQRCLEIEPLVEARGEVAAEGVAGADRIDRLDLQPLGARDHAIADCDDAIAAERDDQGLPGFGIAGVSARPRGRRPPCFPARPAARTRFHWQ